MAIILALPFRHRLYASPNYQILITSYRSLYPLDPIMSLGSALVVVSPFATFPFGRFRRLGRLRNFTWQSGQK